MLLHNPRHSQDGSSASRADSLRGNGANGGVVRVAFARHRAVALWRASAQAMARSWADDALHWVSAGSAGGRARQEQTARRRRRGRDEEAAARVAGSTRGALQQASIAPPGAPEMAVSLYKSSKSSKSNSTRLTCSTGKTWQCQQQRGWQRAVGTRRAAVGAKRLKFAVGPITHRPAPRLSTQTPICPAPGRAVGR